MVPIDYIMHQATRWAHKPYKLIARATLRCLGVPLPKAQADRIPRGVQASLGADLTECMANAESPLDGRG